MVSDAQLRKWYLFFNRKYFKGELPTEPEDIVLFWEPHNSTEDVADCDLKLMEGTFVVRLDPVLKVNLGYAKMALLHEMVHVKIWKKHPKVTHGDVFQAEMLKLAQAGAFQELW